MKGASQQMSKMWRRSRSKRLADDMRATAVAWRLTKFQETDNANNANAKRTKFATVSTFSSHYSKRCRRIMLTCIDRDEGYVG
jgi:hypothetical protein